jgi:hypothetical protein
MTFKNVKQLADDLKSRTLSVLVKVIFKIRMRDIDIYSTMATARCLLSWNTESLQDRL